jgi:hypothetical protein
LSAEIEDDHSLVFVGHNLKKDYTEPAAKV